jgi:hypothetical protein
VDALRSGHNILIISDRGVSPTQIAIPALLALSSIHQHLVAEGLRTTAGLVGRNRVGARSASLRRAGRLRRRSRAPLPGDGDAGLHPQGPAGRPEPEKAIYNYIKAIGKGLSKIMSKMGVSTYMSYCGAQLFEAIGINSDTIEKYFTGTASRVEGIGVFEIAEEAIRLHRPPSATTRCSHACWTPAASTPGAPAAKSTCGRPTRSPSCSTPRAPTTGTRTRNTPRSSTTRAAAT